MCKFKTRFLITLLTFLVGTVLAFIWVKLDNKSVEVVTAQSRPSEIEIPVADNKIPEPPSENEKTVKPNVPKNNSSSRRIKNGGQFCEKYLLKKIAKEKSADSQLVRLKNFNHDDETLSPSVEKWLEYMRKDKLIAAELRNNQQKALLLSSTSYGATGLATSLENWHIEIDNFYSDTFWSFSKNPELMFWDNDGLLNYYSVIYSDEFIENKDWENLTFDIERYKVSSDGKAQLISEERNLKCE